MRRALCFSFLFFACNPPIEPTPPFIRVLMTEPAGFTAPEADRLEFVTTSVVNGNLLTRSFEADITGNPLPTDFVILFSEGIRGQAIDITMTGFLNDVDVYSAKASAIADVSETEVVVSFCGDNDTNQDRQEVCDDGLNNDDNLPNACRIDCRAPVCGDGVFDTDTEQCDDGNQADADGCEANCTLPACGNGIFEPEDFGDSTQGGCFISINQDFATPDFPSEILVLDMNQDGHLDLVSGFLDAEFLSISLGNGDGTFQNIQLVAMPSVIVDQRQPFCANARARTAPRNRRRTTPALL